MSERAGIRNRELVAAVRPYLQPVVDDVAAVAAVVPDRGAWQRAADDLDGGAA